MKTLRIVLVTAIALLVTAPLMAQQERGQRGSRPQLSAVSRIMLRMTKIHAAVEELDLTDEQEESLKGLHEEFGPRMKEAFGKLQGILTDEQESAAKKAGEEAKEAGKEGWAVFVAVEKAVAPTEEQTKKLDKVGEELTPLQREVYRKIMSVLSDEQKEQMKAKMAPKVRKPREKKAAN